MFGSDLPPVHASLCRCLRIKRASHEYGLPVRAIIADRSDKLAIDGPTVPTFDLYPPRFMLPPQSNRCYVEPKAGHGRIQSYVTLRLREALRCHAPNIALATRVVKGYHNIRNGGRMYRPGEVFAGVDDRGNAIPMEEREKWVAKQALAHRVTPAEWAVARTVAGFILGAMDKHRFIPLDQAADLTIDAIRRNGGTIVRREALEALRAAAVAQGLDKMFPTDSPKLRAVKEALANLREGLR